MVKIDFVATNTRRIWNIVLTFLCRKKGGGFKAVVCRLAVTLCDKEILRFPESKHFLFLLSSLRR